MDKSDVDKSRLSASWTILRYVLQSVQLMLLVGDTASFLKTMFIINFLTVQITANGTDLGFFFCAYYHKLCKVFLVFWIQCCWPRAVC